MTPKQQAILDWIHAKSDEAATQAIINLAAAIAPQEQTQSDESEAYDDATD